MKTSVFATLGFTIVTLAAPAFSMEAMRCNVQTSPGVFEPVLRIVTQGKSRDIRLGSEGLSRKIFFRDRRVVAYLASSMAVPRMELPKRISRVCGAVEEENTQAPTRTAAPVAPDPVETTIEEPREEVTDAVSDDAY
jgi:hypothetical protein